MGGAYTGDAPARAVRLGSLAVDGVVAYCRQRIEYGLGFRSHDGCGCEVACLVLRASKEDHPFR
jgi:hypothetical protein